MKYQQKQEAQVEAKVQAIVKQCLKVKIDEQEEEKKVQCFPPDSYSFMALNSPCNAVFWFGFMVFCLQMILLVCLVISATNNEHKIGTLGEVDNPDAELNGFGSNLAKIIPSDDSALVRATQITALLAFFILADSSLEDIVLAVKIFPSSFSCESIDNQSQWLVLVSSLLRLIQGLLATITAVLVVVTSSDPMDIVLNFTAVNFISHLDNQAFDLIKMGRWGSNLREKAKEVEATPLPHFSIKKNKVAWYHWTIGVVAVMTFIFLSFIIGFQASDDYWNTTLLKIGRAHV